MKEIQITRERVNLEQESGTSPKPFFVGESLSGIYPHEGPKGEQHKGNVTVVEILGNEMGYEARARCANKPCTVEVKVYGV